MWPSESSHTKGTCSRLDFAINSLRSQKVQDWFRGIHGVASSLRNQKKLAQDLGNSAPEGRCVLKIGVLLYCSCPGQVYVRQEIPLYPPPHWRHRRQTTQVQPTAFCPRAMGTPLPAV